MLSPVAVAGCAINFIIAAICFYVRRRAGGRDCLDFFALAHFANTLTYALLVPVQPGAAFDAWLDGGGGYVLTLAITFAAVLFLGGTLRIRFDILAWRPVIIGTIVISVLGCLLGLVATPGTAARAAIAFNALLSLVAGSLLFLGQTPFYRLTGFSLLARAVMVALLAIMPATAEGQNLFMTIGILNVVFIAATGFGIILVELDDARRVAADANNAKTQFIANMSHELRTPLNAIIGFSEILEGRAFSPSPEQGRHYASLVLQAGRHLLGMVNALLDMASIEARRENLQPQPVRVDTLLAECVAMLAGEAGARQIRLRMPPAAGAIDVTTDPRALRQILLSLIGNAIKFSPPESDVRIDIEAPADGPVVVSVTDRGPGIAAAHLARIFDPFFQSGDTYSRAKGGVGLGLAIAQRLAQALGGSIAVDSREGQGSRFSIILPCPGITPGPDAGTRRQIVQGNPT